MGKITWKLVCKDRHLINLKDVALQIEHEITEYGGSNVMVDAQAVSFELPEDKMSIGQKATLGRRLAKISTLGRNADVYLYKRKGSKKTCISRQIFRASKDLD